MIKINQVCKERGIVNYARSSLFRGITRGFYSLVKYAGVVVVIGEKIGMRKLIYVYVFFTM